MKIGKLIALLESRNSNTNEVAILYLRKKKAKKAMRKHYNAHQGDQDPGDWCQDCVATQGDYIRACSKLDERVP